MRRFVSPLTVSLTLAVAAAALHGCGGDSSSDAPSDTGAGGTGGSAAGGSSSTAGAAGTGGSGGAVTGDVVAPGFDPADQGKLGGTPDPSVTPTIVYPLPGSLFPANLAPVEVQLKLGAPGQALARVAFHVDGALDLKLYAPCVPINGGCAITLSADLVPKLAAASELGTLTTTVRLADKAGKSLGEAAPLDAQWTTTSLTGGLYYWTTIDGMATAIKRYDFDGDATKPEVYWTQDLSPALSDGTQKPCAGCHAISRDGTKLALTFGGSDPSDFALVDVASKKPIAVKNQDKNGYATMTTFSPDGSRLVNSFRGKLYLRGADKSLADVGTLLDSAPESKTHPFWGPDGKAFAYASWQPGQNGASGSTNGDIERGAQIWIAASDGKTVMGAPTLLVPRQSDRSAYYPAISDDGKWVVFNQSRCDGPPGVTGYGADPCDGYDDASARVLAIAATGGAAVDLVHLNGDATYTNSWPRWAPDHGTFRKKPLYWVAFSSQRPYGLRLPGSTTGAGVPQLWFAAVTLDGATGDPSFSPVWLPGQDADLDHPTGNHVPQWTTKAVPVPQ
jgi:hypothetical protein